MKKCKIVINTNTRYKKALRVCLDSMLDAGFKEFENVIIVISGSEEAKEPRRESLSWIFQDLPNFECTVIETKMDNFEYTSFHMLYVYKDHRLIDSERYLFMMDTCTVGKHFVPKFNRCKHDNFLNNPEVSDFRGKEPGAWLYSCRGKYASNIYLFNKGLVLNYKNNFAKKLDKAGAVLLEGGRTLIAGVKPLKSFGTLIVFRNRRKKIDCKDIYGNNAPRWSHWYEPFGIFKWILLHHHGDFDGKVTKIFKRK